MRPHLADIKKSGNVKMIKNETKDLENISDEK